MLIDDDDNGWLAVADECHELDGKELSRFSLLLSKPSEITHRWKPTEIWKLQVAVMELTSDEWVVHSMSLNLREN